MNRDSEHKISVLLRITAAVFGAVTLLEAAFAVWLRFSPGWLLGKISGGDAVSVGVIGGADGPTSILVSSDVKWKMALLMFVPPVLAAVSLLLLRRSKKL